MDVFVTNLIDMGTADAEAEDPETRRFVPDDRNSLTMFAFPSFAGVYVCRTRALEAAKEQLLEELGQLFEGVEDFRVGGLRWEDGPWEVPEHGRANMESVLIDDAGTFGWRILGMVTVQQTQLIK